MAGNIKGGQVKSIRDLKSSLKKGSGAGYLTRVPEDGSLTVRFLTEPDEWVTFFEHYDSVRKFYPCSDTCPGCDEGNSPSQRYLANALDRDEGKVIPLLLPKTAASSILKRYDKYGTLLDRDYEITRTGSGMDTEYDSIPEAPSKVTISRYDVLDLWELVEAQLGDDDGEEEEEEEERPRRRRTRASGSNRPRRRVKDEDDDDIDGIADEDEDEDEDESPRRRPVKKTVAKRPVKNAPKRVPARTGAVKKAPAKRAMSRR